MTTTTLTRWTPAAAAVTVQTPINEDLVRASLLDALEIIKQAKHGGEGWFEITQCGQLALIHIERRLNAELKALLVGDLSYYTGVQQ